MRPSGTGSNPHWLSRFRGKILIGKQGIGRGGESESDSFTAFSTRRKEPVLSNKYIMRQTMLIMTDPVKPRTGHGLARVISLAGIFVWKRQFSPWVTN
jgi:hypothetical protein